jgi:hypothetical protein
MAKEIEHTILLTLAGVLAATAAHADPIMGPFRGSLVCAQLKSTNNILRAPLDVLVRKSDVIFARPVFNASGSMTVGSELGSGAIDADGKMHLTSTWEFGGYGFTGDYSGVVTAAGGTLTGAQLWHATNGMVDTRACMAAIVPIHVGSE